MRPGEHSVLGFHDGAELRFGGGIESGDIDEPVSIEAAARLLNGAALNAALWVAASDAPDSVLKDAVAAFRQFASGLLIDQHAVE